MRIMRNTRVGDWVEVRSKEEILETLDGSGHLDGMPFMPEMFAFSGKRFRVHKRAHKTCDTVFPIRGRWVDRSVHLETRCDGSAHGGCQAGCLIFWKEAWLKRINVDESDKARYDAETNVPDVRRPAPTRCAEATVWDAAKVSDRDGGPTTYVCQATRLPYSTRPLAWWDVRQYLEDYWSGNVGIGRLISGLIYSMYYNLSQAGIGVGPAMRWLYNRSRWLWRGSLFPRTPGAIPMGQPTPTGA